MASAASGPAHDSWRLGGPLEVGDDDGDGGAERDLTLL
jgi:hypothetical protein